jgi:ABC-type transport system involved in cytochrome c biogenesis permease subunit
MGQLIQLIIYIVVFAVVAYGLFWICQKFSLPQPIVWICGAILLIVVLIFMSQQLGLGGVSVFPMRR